MSEPNNNRLLPTLVARIERLEAEFEIGGPMVTNPLSLSIAETCKQLSISKSFFYLLVKRGQIKPVKLGRRTLVPFVELERLSSGQSPTSAEMAKPTG